MITPASLILKMNALPPVDKKEKWQPKSHWKDLLHLKRVKTDQSHEVPPPSLLGPTVKWFPPSQLKFSVYLEGTIQ